MHSQDLDIVIQPHFCRTLCATCNLVLRRLKSSKSSFSMLLDSALPEGGHLGVSLPILPVHVVPLSGDRAEIGCHV